MGRLKLEKLHIRFLPGSTPEGPLFPRRYTLTHSDFKGDVYLTVGLDYNLEQVSGVYTRFMRDEVLAEWTEGSVATLHVHVHVSGGRVFGSPAKRNRIFVKEIPLVLEAIRAGDAYLVEKHKELDEAEIEVHFNSEKTKYHRVESYGKLSGYATSLTHR